LSVEDWLDHIKRSYDQIQVQREHIEALTLATNGDPAQISSVINELLQRNEDGLQKHVQKALDEFETNKQIIQRQTAREPDPADLYALGVLYDKTGTLRRESGQVQEALAEYRAGMGIFQQLTAGDPDNAAWRRSLSRSHSNVAGIYQIQGRLQEALTEYQASKQMLQQLTTHNPDNAAWRRELSISHNCIGAVLEAQGRLREALAEYEAGKRILLELTTGDPDNPGRREFPGTHSLASSGAFRPSVVSDQPTTAVEHNRDKPPMEVIFISYTRKDEQLRRELQAHLKVLSRDGLVVVWTDEDIGVGDEWRRAINDNLNRAGVILLLVSSDFINSDYCDREVSFALERNEAGGACVIPIIVRDCDWRSQPFAKLEVLPRDGIPVRRRRSRDAVWTSVVEAIRKHLG
jgi:tetratricopeptide (TPR) repeat protein